MSNRLLYISIFILFTNLSYGQLSFTGWSKRYIGVYNYDGAYQDESHTLRLNFNGTNLNEKNWRLSVKVMTPFTSGKNTFPVNTIKLIPKRTNGQSKFPTVEQVNMTTANLNSNSEVFIVRSPNELSYKNEDNGHYYFLELYYDLKVEYSKFLENNQNKRFEGVLLFTAYREDNSVIGSLEKDYTVHVHRLSGTAPPPENQYSISSSHSSALIEYSTLEDYVSGKESEAYGLTVSADTDYEISVLSIDPEFRSDTGDTLPLDIVKLQLGSGQAAVLSNNQTVVLQGKSTGGSSVTFDVKYSTYPNDMRLYDTPSKNYSTQLLYEITPR